MTENKRTVVEVAMEIALSREILEKVSARFGAKTARACAMSNSVGGIGPLLRERIVAQSEMGVDVLGVSLLYENVWVQGFHIWGQIYIEKKKVGDSLKEVLEDTGIAFNLTMPDHSQIQVKVWKAPLGKGEVYYLDSPEIANVIYPGPEDAPQEEKNLNDWIENQKLKQAWLVGRGTLALLKQLNKKPDFIVQSETPTFFANHFLIQDDFQKDEFFKDCQYIFNDHTPLEYAHPVWNEPQIQKARIDPAYSSHPLYWNKERKTIDVTRLLIGVSNGVYGVSKKHAQVMKKMPSLKGFEDKIQFITNGIRVQDWKDPDYEIALSKLDDYLVSLKEKKKEELIEWIWRRYGLWVDWRKQVQKKCFVLWTRRVTSYKRFDVLEKLLKNPDLKKRFLQTEIVVLVGGRIHQNDDLSQNVMFELLDLVTRDPILKYHVLILDNYNIWEAPKLFHGVDATIMLADDGREASATGFMKAQVNGAMVIACHDGAVPESVFFKGKNPPDKQLQENGFEVPYHHGQPQPEG
ncbi:MAG: glycogen/starch/alpha-glucan phosphorylase, partial [Elusimicrobia bacterium]|nr:glycogen/starch/alpha-glucan phosphorylase [Elusimicrobiota bacterium]